MKELQTLSFAFRFINETKLDVLHSTHFSQNGQATSRWLGNPVSLSFLFFFFVWGQKIPSDLNHDQQSEIIYSIITSSQIMEILVRKEKGISARVSTLSLCSWQKTDQQQENNHSWPLAFVRKLTEVNNITIIIALLEVETFGQQNSGAWL